MKEEATTKPEHPEDPRQARPRAPIHLMKSLSWRNPHQFIHLFRGYLLTRLKNLLWHQLLVNHNFKHKLLKCSWLYSSKKYLTNLEPVRCHEKVSFLASVLTPAVFNPPSGTKTLIQWLGILSIQGFPCTCSVWWNGKEGQDCGIPCIDSPGDRATLHMAPSEDHGMGHQAIPKHQPGRLVHPSLNLVVRHEEIGGHKKEHWKFTSTPKTSW